MVLVIFLTNFLIRKNKINDEDDSNRKQTYKGKRDKNKVFKKILCTKEDITPSYEDEVSESETERVLIMEIEHSDKEETEEEYEEEEFDYRE